MKPKTAKRFLNRNAVKLARLHGFIPTSKKQKKFLKQERLCTNTLLEDKKDG